MSSSANSQVWSLGQGTLEIPLSLFAENRQRLVQRLRAHPALAGKLAIVLLVGGSQQSVYDTDAETSMFFLFYFKFN